MCEEAKETLRALTHPGGAEPWKMPECSHCATLVATALIDLEVGAIRATGVGDPVFVLRMLRDGLELPGQREPGDDD